MDTRKEAVIWGTDGSIVIHNPWWGASRFTLTRRGGESEERVFANRDEGYTYEAEAFMDLIRRGRTDSQVMPLEESVGIMKTLDAIRAQWGMKYPME